MTAFTLSHVPEIRFGAGRLADIAPIAEARAGKEATVLLVADPALTGLGITGLACDLLAKAGIAAHVYDGFRGEPTVDDIDKATALARQHGAGMVIGLGGGSAHLGQGARLRPAIQRSNSPRVLSRVTPRMKNRVPSKWSDVGPL